VAQENDLDLQFFISLTLPYPTTAGGEEICTAQGEKGKSNTSSF